VSVLEPALILAQKSIPMVDQNPPKRALMYLFAPVERSINGLRGFLEIPWQDFLTGMDDGLRMALPVGYNRSTPPELR
jgi:hypothetical protein